MNSVTLYLLQEDQTTEFAAQELAKYLAMMDDVQIAVERATSYGAGAPGLALGLLDDVGLALDTGSDPALDDRIHIDVKGLAGVIAGANSRALLNAA